jgi:uncharacterized membrane protein YkoI
MSSLRTAAAASGLVLAGLGVFGAQAPLRAQTAPAVAVSPQTQSTAPADDPAQARARAAERARCLTRDQQRSALADGKAVPLAQALKTLRRRMPGEVVKARLCHDGDRLIYLLTVLPRDGKVRRATVDAANGSVVGER